MILFIGYPFVDGHFLKAPFGTDFKAGNLIHLHLELFDYGVRGGALMDVNEGDEKHPFVVLLYGAHIDDPDAVGVF